MVAGAKSQQDQAAKQGSIFGAKEAMPPGCFQKAGRSSETAFLVHDSNGAIQMLQPCSRGGSQDLNPPIHPDFRIDGGGGASVQQFEKRSGELIDLRLLQRAQEGLSKPALRERNAGFLKRALHRDESVLSQASDRIPEACAGSAAHGSQQFFVQGAAENGKGAEDRPFQPGQSA